MKCDYDYCIYNKNFGCLLGLIEINSLGHCDECIIVSLGEDILEKLKSEQCQKIAKRYDNSGQ